MHYISCLFLLSVYTVVHNTYAFLQISASLFPGLHYQILPYGVCGLHRNKDIHTRFHNTAFLPDKTPALPTAGYPLLLLLVFPAYILLALHDKILLFHAVKSPLSPDEIPPHRTRRSLPFRRSEPASHAQSADLLFFL